MENVGSQKVDAGQQEKRADNTGRHTGEEEERESNLKREKKITFLSKYFKKPFQVSF